MQGKEWAQIQLKLLDSEQQAGHQTSLIAITINLRLSSSWYNRDLPAIAISMSARVITA